MPGLPLDLTPSDAKLEPRFQSFNCKDRCCMYAIASAGVNAPERLPIAAGTGATPIVSRLIFEAADIATFKSASSFESEDRTFRSPATAAFSETCSEISKSRMTSSTTFKSTTFCPSAKPSDRALKQQLLMLRGIPAENCAIAFRAGGANNCPPQYPATRKRC